MFKFKGISTKQMKIIVEEPENLISKASQRVETINIEGRDDSLYYPLGYAPIEISLTLQLLDPTIMDQVLLWLDGEGTLEYKNRKTTARIYSEVQPIRTSGIRIITISVIRSPFWYSQDDKFSNPWGENLISNGWDNFIPYGVGKNYTENWDFRTDDLSEYRGGNAASIFIKNDKLNVVVDKSAQPLTSSSVIITIPNSRDVELGKYIMRIKIKSNTNTTRMYYRPNAAEGVPDRIQQGYTLVPDEWEVIELEVNRTIFDSFSLYVYARSSTADIQLGDTFEIDWIQFTPINNQHLVVEKTPLDNGLTRIQTWGGNRFEKLLYQTHLREYETTFISTMESNGKIFRFTRNNPYMAVLVNKVKSQEIIFKGTDVSERNPNYSFQAININDNLDLVASTPFIITGTDIPTWTDPNPAPRIINEGSAPAKPLIKLTKGTTQTCEFEVNDVYFKYDFKNDDYVVIDCEEMESNFVGLPRDRQLEIGFEFPVLLPGDNIVKTISGDAKIEFSRKDRWL